MPDKSVDFSEVRIFLPSLFNLFFGGASTSAAKNSKSMRKSVIRK